MPAAVRVSPGRSSDPRRGGGARISLAVRVCSVWGLMERASGCSLTMVKMAPARPARKQSKMNNRGRMGSLYNNGAFEGGCDIFKNMATVEEKASPEAAGEGVERYRYVIEEPASSEYRGVQAERASALDRMFEGKDKLPQSLLTDIAGEDFFMRGQARQQAGEVKRLIPDRFFADEEAKREVSEVLEGLRGGRSLDELQDDALLKDGKYNVKRLEALKLVGARLLQEHHPETQGKNWDEISEEEKRTVRLGEMIVHQAEMMALDRRLEEKKQAVPVEIARVFEKNYAKYAKNADISKEQRESYRQMARLLREKVEELEEDFVLDPIKEEELDLTPKGGVGGAESEEVLGGEEIVPLEQETEVGRAVGETVMEKKKPTVGPGAYPEKEEFERKIREHEQALGEETEGLSIFNMSETQVRGQIAAIEKRVKERRRSDDLKVRRGQEIVDEGLGLPEREIKALRRTKSNEQVRQQAEVWREKSLNKIDELVGEEVKKVYRSEPERGERLEKYGDIWLNELGLDRAQARNSLLDKAATRWMETAYRRVKVGSGEETMRAREEFVEVLRQIARGEKVSRDMEAVMDALADRFELMNLRERQKLVEAGKAKLAPAMKRKEGESSEAGDIDRKLITDERDIEGAQVAAEEPVAAEVVEKGGDFESALGGDEPGVPTGPDTEVGMGLGDTVVESQPVKEEAIEEEKTGERSIEEIEEEMRRVYRQVQEMGKAVEPGALREGVALVARKQPELERLRRRWGELEDEIHTRAAQERLQSATVDWLEGAEKEVEGILRVPLETAEEWAEEHDREEKGRVEREEKKNKVAPHVKRGKKLKLLRKRGTKKK